MNEINRRKLYEQFNKVFPIELIKTMPLEKYTNLDRNDSFCYWLEIRAKDLGSIKGGSSSKFGIYKYNKRPKDTDTIVVSDDTYAWYAKYNKATAQEAYLVVRDTIVSIAQYASNGDFEAIDKIDTLGNVVKWKIAFLYSNESLVPVYNRDMLDLVSGQLGMKNPKDKTILEIQRFLMQTKGDEDLFVFYEKVLDILNSQNELCTFNSLKEKVREKLKHDSVFQSYHSGPTCLWIGTKDGRINTSECHYELCSDKHKKASHSKDKVFVELHFETKNANRFENLSSIEGVHEFPWRNFGVRANDEGWRFEDYSTEELADIVIEELHRLDNLVGEEVRRLTSKGDMISSEDMKKNKYQEYIELLKETHNLVLTGAPGTGKTFMAQAIADEMGAETKFVQFHPSYDYTDFVEGLRPVDLGNGQMGFERKDGVFKEFCKEAIKNIVDSEKSIESLAKEMSWQERLERFAEDSIEKGTRFTTVNGSEFIITEMRSHSIIVLNEQNEKTSQVAVSSDEILEILTNEVPLKIVRDIRNYFNRKFGTQPDSYAFAIIEAVREIKQKMPVVEASKINRKPFVFIIDEINRGEASKIFGELFYAIDPGYRGKKDHLVQTQYQNLVPESDVFAKGFYVPENVYILATMNDIDRSVESMDFAMRRRFTWKEITPANTESMLDTLPCAKEAKDTMTRLNDVIAEIDGLGAAYKIGPSYFLKLGDNGGDLNKLWNMNIEPLLREYLRGFRKTPEILDKFKKAYFGFEESPGDDKNDLIDED